MQCRARRAHREGIGQVLVGSGSVPNRAGDLARWLVYTDVDAWWRRSPTSHARGMVQGGTRTHQALPFCPPVLKGGIGSALARSPRPSPFACAPMSAHCWRRPGSYRARRSRRSLSTAGAACTRCGPRDVPQEGIKKERERQRTTQPVARPPQTSWIGADRTSPLAGPSAWPCGCASRRRGSRDAPRWDEAWLEPCMARRAGSQQIPGMGAGATGFSRETYPNGYDATA